MESGVLPISICVVLVIGGLFYSDWILLRDARLEVERLQRVLMANESLISALKDLEVGQRGFLLTGNREYLQPYEKAKAELPGLMDTLRAEVRSPHQIKRVQLLRSLIREKLTEVDATLLVRDQLGPEAALAIIRTDLGKHRMDAVRRVSAELSSFGYSRLLVNSSELESRARRSRFGFLFGFGALAGLLALSMRLIHRAAARREELILRLDEERRRFQVTLASIGDGVITTGETGLVTFLNPVAEQITGWHSQEAEGLPLESIFPLVNEDTGNIVENPARKVIRERRIVGMANHTNLLRRDGSSIPVDDSAAPVYDAANQLQGIVMVFRDVTPRRATERVLRRWQHIFQHAGFGMAVLTPGPQPILDQVNPAFAEMHGDTPEALIGRPYSDVVAPEVWPAKQKLLEGSSPSDHLLTESIHVRKDGSRVPVLADITVVRETNGDIAYLIEYCHDISERQRAQEELRRSEQRYRDTANSLPQLIWTSKPDGTTEYLNDRWQEESGVSIDPTGQMAWTRLLAPEDQERVLEKWNHSLRTGETFQADCRLETKSDTKRWYTCRAVPVRESDGSIVRWFGSCGDIHEQKLAADALRASKEELLLANEALRQSNADLEQFAYAASHDLQEPLRMVALYSQLLKEEYGGRLDGQADTYLTFTSEGALRMEALLRDLLAYSRAAAPEEPPAGGSNSQDALEKALDNLTVMIQEAGAEISRGDLPYVHMPQVHLVQLFQNLISNAIKYRKPNESPRIHVDSKLQEGTCVFSVRDNGLGVAPQHQSQIFRIFGRLHGPEVPGTGIGLALCKKLVERSGGLIWVESIVGEGSTFFFSVSA